MILLLAVIYIVFISLGLPDSLFGVAWPVVHLELGVPESFASVYSVLVGVSTGGLSFIAGRLIRRFGTGNVTFYSILLTAVGLIGMSLSPNIVVMMFFAVVMGYGAGAIDTGLNNYVSLHYKAHHMNWLHCFWGVGVTVSPLIMSGFLTGENGTWRMGYRVIALLQLGIAALVLFSLKNWGKIEKGKQPPEQIKAGEKGESIVQTLRRRGVLFSIFSLGIYCSMEILIGTWGASYLVHVFLLSPGVAAQWVSLYYGGIMLGRLLSGFISMRVHDKNMIRGGIALSFVGVLFLCLPLGQSSLIGLLLIGVGFGPIFPSVLHSIPERFGTAYSADITGYHMGGAYAIGFLTQILFGYIAGATGFSITPFVLLAFCIAFFADNEVTLCKLKNKGEK